MSTMHKFFSIGHFKSFLHHARTKHPEVKTLELSASIKIHGAHIDLVMDYDPVPSFHIQSRNSIISEECDVFGAASFIKERKATIESFFNTIETKIQKPTSKIMIACEYAGKGIQAGVAWTKIPKSLIVLGVKVDDQWISHDVWAQLRLESLEERIYNIQDQRLPRFDLVLDMDDTDATQSILADLVDQVEARCPFASTICQVDGIGEGLVYHAKGYESEPGMYFKVKGDKHTETKVKTLRVKPQETIEELKTINGFVDGVLTPRRVEQAYEYLAEQGLDAKQKTHLGVFIKWLVEDIEKECSDDMEEFGVDPLRIKKEVAQRAKAVYFSKVTM